MEQILDQPLIEIEKGRVKYGGFWIRFGALLIDGLILAPLTFGVTYLNITAWKSPFVLVVISLLSVAYKPYMEFAYGATFGKMAFKLQVLNKNLERATLSEILLRNVFHITPTLITLFFTIFLFQSPEFQSVSGYAEYSEFISGFSRMQYINWLTGLVAIADAIVLLADKCNRSWHDKIGATCVIEKPATATYP